MKKLFTIGCPVILATRGVALLFIVRKKRKEKRLKRLRGRRVSLCFLSCAGHSPLAWSTVWMKEGVHVPLKGALTPAF